MQPTAKARLAVLETGFLVHRLPAYSGNYRMRLIKMPKLHFLDTGLLCWLLGIREPEQIRTHPLRGAIFETWVVSEIVKRQANRGDRNGLSFYRERNGAEVDLLLQEPSEILLVGARSTATATASLLDGPNRVRKQFVQAGHKARIVVVYGGDQSQQRGADQLLSWRDLHNIC